MALSALLLSIGMMQVDDLPARIVAQEKALLEGKDGAKPASGKPEAAGTQEPVALNPNKTVLLDKANCRLLLKCEVCLREGALELLCCRKGTKEHEAILSLDSDAFVVHTGLLALGAKVGTPAVFDPEYRPPSGQKIQMWVNWTDAQGKNHREPAQTWVRYLTRRFYTVMPYELPAGVTLSKTSELKYDKNRKELFFYGQMTEAQRDAYLKLSQDATFQSHIRKFFDDGRNRQMNAEWVFTGSGFYKDPDTGKKFYLAEDGDLICVANFSSATIDVALRSTAEGAENLLFEAWTDRIPKQKTAVTLELAPDLEGPSACPEVKSKSN